MRIVSLLVVAAIGLAACATPNTGTGRRPLGPDGLPLPVRYDIGPGDAAEIQFRMLDSLNSLRRARGVAPLQMNAQLNAAAATHSRDMSVQNRPWHFGSDGSSPVDRAQRVGFVGRVTGEVISETYETELETLAAWMNQPDTRGVLLDPAARNMGFAWRQEKAGKIWWTLVLGT